jgi:hypothetical protein
MLASLLTQLLGKVAEAKLMHAKACNLPMCKCFSQFSWCKCFSQNCKQITATTRRSIFHAAKSLQMPYKAPPQKNTYFHNKIQNPLELRLVDVQCMLCVPFVFLPVPFASHGCVPRAQGPGPGNMHGWKNETYSTFFIIIFFNLYLPQKEWTMH